MSYGTLGNIYDPGNYNNLPDWLRSQWTQQSNGGDDGGYHLGMPTQYVDRSGKPFVQLGEAPGEGGMFSNGGKVLDPSKVRWDSDFGYVTDPENFKGAEPVGMLKDPMFWQFVAMVVGGAGLGAFGGEAGALGGGGYVDAIGNAAEGANAGASLTGAVTPGAGALGSGPSDSYWSQLASNSGQTDVPLSEYGFGGETPPMSEYGYGAQPPPMSELGGGSANFGLGSGGLDPETLAGQGGMGFGQNGIGGLLGEGGAFEGAQLTGEAGLGSLTSWIAEHPGDALRMGLGAGTIINALSNRNGGSSSNGGGGGGAGGIPWNGPMPTFNPQQGQFQQNPYLNYRVPFMGGF